MSALTRTIVVACGLMAAIEAVRRDAQQGTVTKHVASTGLEEHTKGQQELQIALQRLDNERSSLVAALAAISHEEVGRASAERTTTDEVPIVYQGLAILVGAALFTLLARAGLGPGMPAPEKRSTGEWVSIVYRVFAIVFGLVVFSGLMTAPGGLSGFFVPASKDAIFAYSKHVLETPPSFDGVPDYLGESTSRTELSKNVYQGILLGARAYMSALTGITIVYAYSLFFIPFKDMYPLFLGVAAWFLALGAMNISTIALASGPYIYPISTNTGGVAISTVFTLLAGYSCYASKNGL